MAIIVVPIRREKKHSNAFRKKCRFEFWAVVIDHNNADKLSWPLASAGYCMTLNKSNKISELKNGGLGKYLVIRNRIQIEEIKRGRRTEGQDCSINSLKECAFLLFPRRIFHMRAAVLIFRFTFFCFVPLEKCLLTIVLVLFQKT